MGVRENKVEKYLHEQVEALGGTTRKWVSPGRDGVPDRIVFYKRKVWFIEVKTIDGVVSSVQQREIERLRTHGATVLVLHGVPHVDFFITQLKKL